MHRHNGGPLSEDDTRKLFNHIRAIEVIEEAEQDLRDDKKVRKELAKKDGFDPKILDVIVKRRKLGAGETRASDTLIKMWEEALDDEGVLPLEQTRITAPPRRTLDEISQQTHGVELGAAAPPGKETLEEALERTKREFEATHPGTTVTFGSDTDPF